MKIGDEDGMLHDGDVWTAYDVIKMTSFFQKALASFQWRRYLKTNFSKKILVNTNPHAEFGVRMIFSLGVI